MGAEGFTRHHSGRARAGSEAVDEEAPEGQDGVLPGANRKQAIEARDPERAFPGEKTKACLEAVGSSQWIRRQGSLGSPLRMVRAWVAVGSRSGFRCHPSHALPSNTRDGRVADEMRCLDGRDGLLGMWQKLAP